MEGPNVIVVDMDDVMYNLNEKVARMNGIPYWKFTQFSVFSNPNMTEEEKQKVLAAYTNADTYRDVEFIMPVIGLINKMHRDYPQYEVHIVSNSATREVRDVKLPQLLRVLELPEERIHLKVIDMATQSLQKKLPDNMFMIIDDSPHNIAMADALHKVMPARLHNSNVLKGGKLGGYFVDRPETPDELRSVVLGYMKRGI